MNAGVGRRHGCPSAIICKGWCRGQPWMQCILTNRRPGCRCRVRGIASSRMVRVWGKRREDGGGSGGGSVDQGQDDRMCSGMDRKFWAGESQQHGDAPQRRPAVRMVKHGLLRLLWPRGNHGRLLLVARWRRVRGEEKIENTSTHLADFMVAYFSSYRMARLISS